MDRQACCGRCIDADDRGVIGEGRRHEEEATLGRTHRLDSRDRRTNRRAVDNQRVAIGRAADVGDTITTEKAVARLAEIPQRRAICRTRRSRPVRLSDRTGHQQTLLQRPFPGRDSTSRCGRNRNTASLSCDHSGCTMDSPRDQRRAAPCDGGADRVKSATHSSVPSHGMSGWFHCSHASVGLPPPSALATGDSRGAA